MDGGATADDCAVLRAKQSLFFKRTKGGIEHTLRKEDAENRNRKIKGKPKDSSKTTTKQKWVRVIRKCVSIIYKRPFAPSNNCFRVSTAVFDAYTKPMSFSLWEDTFSDVVYKQKEIM